MFSKQSDATRNGLCLLTERGIVRGGGISYIALNAILEKGLSMVYSSQKQSFILHTRNHSKRKMSEVDKFILSP